MRVFRRFVVVVAAMSIPAAVLGSGCSDKIVSYPGLPNENPSNPTGAGGPASGGDAGGGGGGGAAGDGDAGGDGDAMSLVEDCTCAISVSVGGGLCGTCFDEATGDAGLCAAVTTACVPSSACGVTAACVLQCLHDPTCVMGCITTDGSADYLAYLSCLCSSCSASCPSTASCSADGGPADAAGD
jgi:hypothetical protein